MPGWRNLYQLPAPFYNNSSSSGMEGDDVMVMEERRIAYDMAEVGRVLRLGQSAAETATTGNTIFLVP
jgi:hypothetical protein